MNARVFNSSLVSLAMSEVPNEALRNPSGHADGSRCDRGRDFSGAWSWAGNPPEHYGNTAMASSSLGIVSRMAVLPSSCPSGSPAHDHPTHRRDRRTERSMPFRRSCLTPRRSVRSPRERTPRSAWACEDLAPAIPRSVGSKIHKPRRKTWNSTCDRGVA